MPKRILGIDPGFADMGFGVVEEKAGQYQALAYGSLRTKPKQPFADRLFFLSQELEKLIRQYTPQIMAIEELFFFKNVKTALQVGQARGVAILTAAQAGLIIKEFTPLEIKQAVAAYGRAEKRQVQEMVKILLNLKEIPRPDDAADALAAAICCLNTKDYVSS